jgi:hypothetical protein
VPGLPQVLVDRGFGDPDVPVNIVWTGTEIDGMEGAITLAGTDDVPPNGTRWVFTDPTPVWRCFVGAETREFEEGTFAAAEASLMLRVGKDGTGVRLSFHPEPGWGSVTPAKGRPNGGDWRFDAAATKRLAELLSATPPTEVGGPPRK